MRRLRLDRATNRVDQWFSIILEPRRKSSPENLSRHAQFAKRWRRSSFHFIRYPVVNSTRNPKREREISFWRRAGKTFENARPLQFSNEILVPPRLSQSTTVFTIIIPRENLLVVRGTEIHSAKSIDLHQVCRYKRRSCFHSLCRVGRGLHVYNCSLRPLMTLCTQVRDERQILTEILSAAVVA